MTIQWYPGHMNKARKELASLANEVDLIIELRDARIPYSSMNPDLRKIIGSKPHFILLNKDDLADSESTKIWLDALKKESPCLSINTKDNKRRYSILQTIYQAAEPFVRRSKLTGKLLRMPRVLIVGIPNVGKSSVINFLTGRSTAKTGAKPGLTRSTQLLTADNLIQIVDSPGVLWPRFDSREQAIRLAACGAIREGSFGLEDVLEYIVKVIAKDCTLTEYLHNFAEERNFIVAGNRLDMHRAKNTLLKEFQEGKLGRFTLEMPKNEEVEH